MYSKFVMSTFLKKPDVKCVNTLVRFYSLVKLNHYEVLRLKKSCTDKEIKEAFFKLSKEFHPDKNKSSKAQEKFVRIVEAYNVLSKPSSRAQYDHTTHVYTASSPNAYRTYSPNNRAHSQSHNYSYNYNYYYQANQEYTQKNKRQTDRSDSRGYYGFLRIPKMPNYVIVLGCFGFAMIGLVLQIAIIRESFLAQKRRAMEASVEAAKELEKVRANARDNGNEVQARLLLEKIVSAANPTVATASLGQALAILHQQRKMTVDTRKMAKYIKHGKFLIPYVIGNDNDGNRKSSTR